MESGETSPDREAELVAGVQRGDERAMTLLCSQYTPILRREAARLGARGLERDELVADALRGVVQSLTRPGSASPRSLTPYVLVTLRNAWRRALRAARRQAARERALYQELLTRPAGADASDALDDARSASADGGASGYARALGTLADVLRAELTDDERQILTWLSDYVPQREIADWLGMSHGALRTRVHRLRERLRSVGRRHAETLAPAEQRELERFFRRTGTMPPATQTRRATRGRSATDAETS